MEEIEKEEVVEIPEVVHESPVEDVAAEETIVMPELQTSYLNKEE